MNATSSRQGNPQDSRAARRARRSLLRSREEPNNAVAETQDEELPRTDSGSGEEIHEDDTCPICQLLLHEPVTTACKHTLCKYCMATWASVSLAQPMVIVDVDEEPVDFDPVSELQARCPMCRTLTAAQPDGDRAAALKGKYPRAYGEREAEGAAEGAADGGGEEGVVQTITVYIGNRHQAVPARAGDPAQNTHDWTFFVRPSRTDIIEEVHIDLHPTFRQNHVVRQRPPYAIARIGWGVFQITASVILKPGYAWVSDDALDTPDGAVKGMLPLAWMLDFDGFNGKGSMARCRLKVKNDRGWEAVQEEQARDARELRRTVRQYERDGRYEPRR